jgi:hypothetical protein
MEAHVIGHQRETAHILPERQDRNKHKSPKVRSRIATPLINNIPEHNVLSRLILSLKCSKPRQPPETTESLYPPHHPPQHMPNTRKPQQSNQPLPRHSISNIKILLCTQSSEIQQRTALQLPLKEALSARKNTR